MIVVNPQRSVIFIGVIAFCIILGLSNFNMSKFERRMRDLKVLSGALENYRARNGQYPPQGNEHLEIGVSKLTGLTGIDVLVPHYISAIPRDLQRLYELNRQYLYFSDGKDYKLIAYGLEDVGWVIAKRPEHLDPRRPTYAYGIWTAGAVDW